MPKHEETRLLPYRPEQLFDLVADIARYPEFLPWCKSARIVKRDGDLVTADLVIGYKMLRERFTSAVTLAPPQRISVAYLSGPLAHLRNEWQFRPAPKGGCALHFHVDFDFRSRLLGGMMELFFEKALSKMATAFEARAGELYGPR
jgi:coenzyme Q-binding protein COQ10